ncbi:MAG: TaqI-like C-terminal specificity domain-containing protein [Pseudomonadota bacterium]
MPIQALVERFTSQLDTYKQSSYNETQTRTDFINPFFKALGWDVNNEQGLAETYRDVVHEDALKIGRATKMPDYSFRVGGVRKFFVEAKKPAINLFKKPESAYQVRRYGWNAKLSISILTNFAEFAVYDCRIKPDKNDGASTARLFYIKYSDYQARWDELVALFSFEAVWQGEFDKYAATQLKNKKGNIEVDTAFLAEIERWREMLARQIALDNPKLTQRQLQLNRSVQQTIDRIIFLRICEDRGIEDYGRLLTLQNGTQVYKRLFQFFRQADERYNSGLFHFKAEKARDEPDNLTPTLRITDDILKDIIKNLYYPDSPYEFSVLPADILGQVYERFLGKVICLSSDRKALVEEKPEVKKAGGVYYTPSYIVDYIVEQTVMPLLKGKKAGPRGAASRLKILDPACGSGSFLLGAYQRLLDWHLEQYLQAPDKWVKGKKPRIYQSSGGSWKLTVDERKRILLNNIYGVDIDQQAVEVTKLSLLLKVLEDEQSVISQLSLFEKRVLPDLESNIKCGNSLIGNDFYAGQQLELLDEELLYRVNAFDWESEFKAGGFDAVIGNPPYVRQELLGDSKSYFKDHYRVFHGVADLYVYFIEKGVSLLRENGQFGIIVANKWMRANYGKPLRQWLKLQHLTEITDFGDLPVFQQATTYPCILGIQKTAARATFKAVQVKTLDFSDLKTYVVDNGYFVQQASLDDSGWALVDEKTRGLLDKLLQVGVPLGEYVKIYYGIKTGLNEAFVIDAETRERLIAADAKSEVLIKRFLVGRDVKRYQSFSSERYLIFTRRGVDIKQYPAIERYLLRFKERLMPKPKDWEGGKWQGRKSGSYEWYEIQDTVAYYQEFEKPKIIIPAIVQKASYTFDNTGFYSNDKTSIIATDDLYLLGLLNSQVLDFVLHSIASTKQGGYFEYKPMYVQQLPIRPIDFDNPTDKTNHDKMVKLVEQILALNKQLAAATESLKRPISAIEGEIDQLVYGLYGLTEEEIGIVEESQ